jgi:hypothetical protein
MRRTVRHARRLALRALAAGVLLAGAAACEDAIGIGEHNNVAELTLTVGPRTVQLTSSGAGGALTVSAGTFSVSAVARDRNGRSITLQAGSSLAITSANQGVARFTSLGALAGTLVTAPGSTQLTVAVMHAGHADFEQSVTINVQ